MESLYRIFATDQEKEKKGIWLRFGGPAIKIARAGGANRAFAETLERKLAPLMRQGSLETLPPEAEQRLMIETYAEAVLLDWEAVTDETGQPLAFSAGNAVKLLTDLPELFAVIRREAQQLARFKREEREATVKN